MTDRSRKEVSMKLPAICLLSLTAFLVAACAPANVPTTANQNTANVSANSEQGQNAQVANVSQIVPVSKSSNAPAAVAKHPSSTCPATVPPANLYVPPSPYPPKAPYGGFWFGSDQLWTSLHPDGKWGQLLHGDKVFWWSNGYDGTSELTPSLKITGRRLDGDGTFSTTDATNALHQDFGGWTMLTGIQVPSAGCWEITGEYGTGKLRFVVEVTE
jgi:hypothetical protein